MINTAEKKLEAILALPLTHIQKRLGESLLSNKITELERDQIIADIENVTPAAQKKIFAAEAKNIRDAITQGRTSTPPNLSTPELQLLWATHLTYLTVHSSLPLSETPLWKQLLDCDDAKHELTKHALFIARDAINPDTRLKWGVPGSMFYFNPADNEINIDFVMSLIGGFADTRSILFHEIGHSKLTRKFTQKMQAIREEMASLNKKGQTTELSKDEYATLAGLGAAWQFMHRVFDEAENSPVNRYAINLSGKMGQDYGHSLNVVETTIANADGHKLPDSTNPTPMEKFTNLNRAVRMSLYKNNGLFDDTEAGWKRIGVRTDWVEALPHTVKGKKPTSKEAFKELMELCGGKKGLEHLQPGVVDRMKGAAWFESKTDEYSDKRNAIIEDEIWRRYAEPLVKQMIEEAKQNAREQVEQKQQQQGEQGQNQQGEGQQGQGKQGEGQSGQGQSGQSQSGEGQNGQGQPGQGQPSGKGKSGSGKPLKVEGAGEMQETPETDVPPETPQAAKNKSKKSAGDKGEKDSQGGDDKSEEKDGSGKEKAADKKNEGSEGGKIGDEDVGKDGAGKDNSPDKDNKNKDGRKTSKPEGTSIADLLEEHDRKNNPQPDIQQTEASEGGKEKSSSQPGKGTGSSRQAAPRPPVGDWKDYQASMAQFAPEIRQARALLQGIQDKQARITHRPTHMRDLLPDDGDMGRFDEGAHGIMVTKIMSRQKIGEDDARRFSIDEEKKTPASIDVVIHIDGSGSMYDPSSSSGKTWPFAPIQAGINTACILNEAARDPARRQGKSEASAINVWTNMWGNDPPLVITKPGDDQHKVGKAIAGLRNSNGWGTELAPAIKHMTQTLAEQKANATMPVGFTHHITVSDGDIADPATAIATIEKLLTACPKVTFDVVVIQDRQTQMDNVVKRLQDKFGEARVKLVHCDSPEQAHANILTLLRERMLATGHSTAIPFEQRRKTFQIALASM